MTLAELIPVLETAIGPVILISGVGLLLLTMTNRLGRAIDRGRFLHDINRSLSALGLELGDGEGIGTRGKG